MRSCASLLREMVLARLPRTAGSFWHSAIEAACRPFNGESFLRHFAGVTRHLRTVPLSHTPAEQMALERAQIDWPLGASDDLGRLALLASAAEQLYGPDHVALSDDCYRRGDLREQRAVLRSLPLWPSGERFREIALSACRSHVRPTFAAIAVDNPYPARCFDADELDRMVHRARAFDLPLQRIVGGPR
jgi:hypothetical protein